MKTLRAVALALISTAFIGSSFLPVMAQEQQRDLIRIMRQEESPLRALVVEKLITFNFSPTWWQYALNRDTKMYHMIGNMADSLLDFASNMGWDDPRKLEQSGSGAGSGSGRSTLVKQAVSSLANKVHLFSFASNLGINAPEKLEQSGSEGVSSPLVRKAVADLENKIHCTIELTDDVNEDTKAKVVENVALFGQPITNVYYCKPRGGKLNLVITLDNKLQTMKFLVSKDGTDYRFTIPAYIDLFTGPIENAFKEGT